jgi:hypothetical protein
MTPDKHPAEVLAAYAEMWACGGADHNARCGEVSAMLRTIPALEESARQQAIDYLALDSQCAELIAERDKLREALAEADRLMDHCDEPTAWRDKWAQVLGAEPANV